MSISLYDATVASFLQALGAMEVVLAKGVEHCNANNIDLQSIVDTRVYPDMYPFRFQVNSIVGHSVGAIEGVRKGSYTPSGGPELDYPGLQKAVADARQTLLELTRDEVNGFAGREVIFEFRGNRMPFTAENFLLSFSMPNFYFHASMTYGILRSKGVPLGKRHFMGQLRLKQ